MIWSFIILPMILLSFMTTQLDSWRTDNCHKSSPTSTASFGKNDLILKMYISHINKQGLSLGTTEKYLGSYHPEETHPHHVHHRPCSKSEGKGSRLFDGPQVRECIGA